MGNSTSYVKSYFFIVKQVNPNLPLCPFIHLIKDVVINGEYCGIESIGLYKEKEIFVEVLDLITSETFYVKLTNEYVLNDGTLGINAAKVYEIPRIPYIRIVTTKNLLFMENDQILGIENFKNTDIIEQLDVKEPKRVVVLRNNKICVINIASESLGCEIGIGLLYKPEYSGEEIYIQEYNGNVKKTYNYTLSNNNIINSEKLKAVDNNNIDYNTEMNKFVTEDAKYFQGQRDDIEDAAVVINNQFIASNGFTKNGVVKEEIFNERKLQNEKLHSNVLMNSVDNNCLFGMDVKAAQDSIIFPQPSIQINEAELADKQSSSSHFNNKIESKNQSIHYSDCGCNNENKNSKLDFVDSDDNAFDRIYNKNNLSSIRDQNQNSLFLDSDDDTDLFKNNVNI